jgi:alkanesulfonate monooxygenase SsuD/methylene tetrahydromethanopterin reductase-like flavin-dependent oxidoreductase (luciferase family)
VRFGLFTTLYDCGGGAASAADLLDNLREQVVLAEELGYDAVWMGEHHFGPYGLGDLPNPILVGADLAVRTKRIRIGQILRNLELFATQVMPAFQDRRAPAARPAAGR